jgi:hypothetical protein
MTKQQMECTSKSISHTERDLLQVHRYSRQPSQRCSLSPRFASQNERAAKEGDRLATQEYSNTLAAFGSLQHKYHIHSIYFELRGGDSFFRM